MYTANINDYKIKKDELMREAEKQRLVKAAIKTRTENRMSRIVRQLFS
jgi:hypothetical protein